MLITKQIMFTSKKYWLKSFVFIFAGLLLASAFLFAKTNLSSGANREFAQAEDFPRGALVYAQIKDLPALVKLWDASELKQNYLKSQNFSEFQNRHLALKLVSRWQEFNEALGFELDAAKIAGTIDNRAAIGVYDIGKLEFVFIAPLAANEKLVAALEFWNRAKFEENELPDKTIYYSREVQADRGRQQQKIVFAVVKKRFVLATNEKLLFETISNLNGQTGKNRLSDDPDFSGLAEKTTAHLGTVWVNQTKLNEDWYFKHYWLMRNVSKLKNIRAGMFDFEMADKKIIERRTFLSNENTPPEKTEVSAADSEFLQRIIPADAAFFKVQSVTNQPTLATDLIVKTLLDKSPAKMRRKRSRRWNSSDSFSSDAPSDYHNYKSLNSDFDENIDGEETETETVSAANSIETKRAADLEQIMIAAGASSAATITNPQVLENPLFAEFQRAVVFTLQSPTDFNQTEFENCVLEIVQTRFAVRGANLNLSWETTEAWRELKLPALGWQLGYLWQNNELIIANHTDLLKSMLESKNAEAKLINVTTFDELAVIRLSRRQSAFDGVMQKIESKKITDGDETNDQENSDKTKSDKAKDDFFTGNIGSLLDAIKDVERIEIKKNNDGNYLIEEISFILK